MCEILEFFFFFESSTNDIKLIHETFFWVSLNCQTLQTFDVLLNELVGEIVGEMVGDLVGELVGNLLDR